MNTKTIQETIRLWTAQPEKALVRPVVKARADGSQALVEAGSFSWRTDLPAMLGGTNQHPSPTALLLGALAGCAVVFIHDTLGPQLGVRITDVQATARCQADFRGLLGMNGIAPDIDSLQIDIEVTTPDGEADAQRIFQAWIERCPVYLALKKPIVVGTGFTTKR